METRKQMIERLKKNGGISDEDVSAINKFDELSGGVNGKSIDIGDGFSVVVKTATLSENKEYGWFHLYLTDEYTKFEKGEVVKFYYDGVLFSEMKFVHYGKTFDMTNDAVFFETNKTTKYSEEDNFKVLYFTFPLNDIIYATTEPHSLSTYCIEQVCPILEKNKMRIVSDDNEVDSELIYKVKF